MPKHVIPHSKNGSSSRYFGDKTQAYFQCHSIIILTNQALSNYYAGYKPVRQVDEVGYRA